MEPNLSQISAQQRASPFLSQTIFRYDIFQHRTHQHPLKLGVLIFQRTRGLADAKRGLTIRGGAGQTLRVQLSRTSVRVIELAPPAVATDFNKGQEEMNAGPRMSADAFARAAIQGLEKDRDEVLPGPAKVLRLMGRLNPHATLRAALAAAMGK